MADSTEKTENAIIRRTAREDMVIEDAQNDIQELVFANINLDAYLNDPTTEIARLTRIAASKIGDALDEGFDIGDMFGVELEKARK